VVSALSGSIGGAGTYQSSSASPVDLRARLDRYQKQLSDCVNCSSAATPQGKADIAAIRARIDEVKQAIAQTSDAHPGSAPVGNGKTASPSSTSSPLGSLIDTFA
jgi:hypothetical protein